MSHENSISEDQVSKMSVMNKIAEELFTKHPQVAQASMERRPFQPGDRVIDAGVADIAARPEFLGTIKEVRAARLCIEWDDGSTDYVHSSVVRRVAAKYEQPIGPQYVVGDKVALGNGSQGVIIKHVTGPTGFRNFAIRVTKSANPSDVGRHVYATPDAMKHQGSLRKDASVQFFHDNVLRLTVACELAHTREAQAIGLQKVSSIDRMAGMLFPYDPPRDVSFHMARVGFNIDLVFVGVDSRVASIVHNVQPGTKGSWGLPNASAVVEMAGGLAKDAAVHVGDRLVYKLSKTAQEFFEPSQNRPDWHTRRPTEEWKPGEHRYRDRQLPDDMVNNDNYLDDSHWHQEIGYDPANSVDDNEGIVPQRPSVG